MRSTVTISWPRSPATTPHTQGLGTARWSVPTERGRLDVTVKVAPEAITPATTLSAIRDRAAR